MSKKEINIINVTEGEYKEFVFPIIEVGNCKIENTKIYFRSNGKGNINGIVWTTSTQFGDILHIKFRVYNRDGEKIYESKEYDVPEHGRIHANDKKVVCNEFEFLEQNKYPHMNFSNISSVTLIFDDYKF